MTRALATGRAALVTVPRTSRTGGTGVSDRAGAAAAKTTTAMANVRNRRINLLRLLKAERPGKRRARPPLIPQGAMRILHLEAGGGGLRNRSDTCPVSREPDEPA